jgi:hypothetical protein
MPKIYDYSCVKKLKGKKKIEQKIEFTSDLISLTFCLR